MMFIKLTYVSDTSNDPVYLAVSAITSIEPAVNGSFILIMETSYRVKETVTEVLNLIGAIVK